MTFNFQHKFSPLHQIKHNSTYTIRHKNYINQEKNYTYNLIRHITKAKFQRTKMKEMKESNVSLNFPSLKFEQIKE